MNPNDSQSSAASEAGSAAAAAPSAPLWRVLWHQYFPTVLFDQEAVDNITQDPAILQEMIQFGNLGQELEDEDEVITPSRKQKAGSGSSSAKFRVVQADKSDLSEEEREQQMFMMFVINRAYHLFVELQTAGPRPKLTGQDGDERILTLDSKIHFPGEHFALQNDIRLRPELAIACLNFAAHTVFSDIYSLQPRIKVQFHQFEIGKILMRDLKSKRVGQFVQVAGTVVRVSNIKPVVTEAVFKCLRCSGMFSQILPPDGKYTLPTRCLATPDCRAQPTQFELQRSLCTVTDWQKIRIQENNSDDATQDVSEQGRVPRTVEIEAKGDLVDSCVPGDNIRCCGIVKVISQEQLQREHGRGGGGGGGGGAKGKTMHFIYIEANSIVNTKKTAEEGEMDAQFSDRELDALLAIAEDQDPFHLIVNSLCPTIYGHEVVKAGLALCMFGGCSRHGDDEDMLRVRGDPHALVVGDPGLGKSQMLQAISRCAARGVYVCGNTTTTTGLTVTVSRDAGTGDYALDAGALIIADQGLCCIDEFDKMKSEHTALLEAMEQQVISIAKAGIVCNLPARCSVIAAANPAGGHYNKSKTIAENLKISPALLSRFDLIFILLDNAKNQETDAAITAHVLALHAGEKNARSQVPRASASTSAPSATQGPESDHLNNSVRNVLQEGTDATIAKLQRRLRLSAVPDFAPAPPNILRKYIMYARKYVNPKLNPQAQAVLKGFYQHLRASHQKEDMTPITTRQLEALYRLAQARAKLELREEVTEQDARDVIAIMLSSMRDVIDDGTGHVDFARFTQGVKKSATQIAKALLQALKKEALRKSSKFFLKSELWAIARKTGLFQSEGEIFGTVNHLNDNTQLIKKADGYELYEL